MTRPRDLITLDEAKTLAAITPKQAGHLLQLGKNATYQGIRTGAIPSYTVNGRILVPVDSPVASPGRRETVSRFCLARGRASLRRPVTMTHRRGVVTFPPHARELRARPALSTEGHVTRP